MKNLKKGNQNRWGYFDKEAQEYVIIDPRTPTPWMNYLFNDDYYCLISNTGGGYSFYKSARDYRILRMRLNSIPFDRPGRYIYIRDRRSGDYWSTGWAPVMPSLDKYFYRCRHGFGYTIIEGEKEDIFTQVTYTVDEKEPVELWELELINKSKDKKEITIFPYAEFCLFQALHDMQNFQYTYNVAQCEIEGSIIHHVTNAYNRPYYSFFAASEEPSGFDTDRESFIGLYRSEANPQVVEEGRCNQSTISGGNPVAVFSLDIDLKPGEKRSFVFIVGYHEDGKDGARKLTKKFARPGVGGELVHKWREYWKSILSSNQVDSPDDDFNLCYNQWIPFQTQVTFRVSRGPSIYEGGIGRGMGTRDSSQDILGALYLTPEKTGPLLLNIGKIQFKEGRICHQFFPLTGEAEGKDIYSDTVLWFIMAVIEYIKYTADWDILNAPVAWVDDKKTASLYEHLLRGIEYTIKNKGEHGLPLILLADWNDMLKISGLDYGADKKEYYNLRAESVMVAFMLYKVLADMKELAKRIGKADDASGFAKEAKDLKKSVEKYTWDGEWFLRAFDNEGKSVGSKTNKEAQIFLNAQTWAVLSGMEKEELGREAMQSTSERLDTKYGLILLDPPYDGWQKENPAITTYPPGLKENGGIFCHANPWAVIAECELGDGDRAYEYFKKLMPTTHDKMQDIYKVEPYVYAQMMAGRHHPQFGMARNSWLTGAASWNYIAAASYILGIKADFDGLRFDPCLPSHWEKCEIKRKFRDIIFNISISKPRRICRAPRKNGKIRGLTITTSFGQLKDNLLLIDKGDKFPKEVDISIAISGE